MSTGPLQQGPGDSMGETGKKGEVPRAGQVMTLTVMLRKEAQV